MSKPIRYIVEIDDEINHYGERVVDYLVEIGWDHRDITHLVSTGKNKFLVESKQNLDFHIGTTLPTRSGTQISCRYVQPPSLTLNVFGMDIDWPHSLVVDKIKPYMEEYMDTSYGSLRNFPHIRNGIRHIKFRGQVGTMPRELNIAGRNIKLRSPGQPVRDKLCLKCGEEGHIARNCTPVPPPEPQSIPYLEQESPKEPQPIPEPMKESQSEPSTPSYRDVVITQAGSNKKWSPPVPTKPKILGTPTLNQKPAPVESKLRQLKPETKLKQTSLTMPPPSITNLGGGDSGGGKHKSRRNSSAHSRSESTSHRSHSSHRSSSSTRRNRSEMEGSPNEDPGGKRSRVHSGNEAKQK